MPRVESLPRLLMFLLGLLCCNSMIAQEEVDPLEALGILDSEPPKPVITVTLSGVENSLKDIAWMFDEADRPDMVDFLNGILADRAGDLKGLDRTKPAGVMVFLEAAFPPRPVPVAYLPVANIDDFVKTMDLGPLKLKKVEGSEDRYEMTGRRRSQHALYRDGYLYLSRNEDMAMREDLPVPADFAPPVTSKYDLAVTIDLTSVPDLLRDAFLGFLRTQAEAELQRRDDEPEGAYLARRANGINGLEMIELLLKEGDKLTIGLDASQDQRRVTVDFSLDVKPGGELAENSKAFASRPTAFGALLEDESQPLTMAASFTLNKREKKVYGEYVRSFETGLKSRFTELDGGELTTASSNLISRVVDPLRSTVEEGHLDFCLQFRAVEPQKFAIVGGVRIVGGDTLATGLEQLIARAGELDENLEEFEVNAASVQGVSLHRLRGPDRSNGKSPLGADPSLYLGASGRTLWFGVGDGSALTELEFAIGRQAEGVAPGSGNSQAPFKAVVHPSRWLKLPDENPDEGREIAEDAFDLQDDAARLEVRPTASGIRVRAQFEKSFVRFIGNLLARQYDKTQL
ncbi:MAG: hypothetical protein KDA58_06765 [Planctomycetaceae bacterium]|nr:hypothetical protein [Planctomycetaceae bacterium]